LIVATHRCADHGHAEFVLEVDPSAVPEQHIEQIIQTLEGMVAHGSVFTPGQTLQVGWMITQVQRHDEMRLTLFEPDMRSLAVKYVPGVTETLREMMLQLLAPAWLPRGGYRVTKSRASCSKGPSFRRSGWGLDWA